MRRRPLVPILLPILLALPAAARGQRAVFVVRHAEKISEEDQRLSDAGRRRAERLAAMLAAAGVTAVYATDTERAKDTARPLAGARGLSVGTYDTAGGSGGAPVDARAFARTVGRDQPNGVVLVVGHSNTVPALLEAFGVREAVTLGPTDYDNLFVVVPSGGGGPATLVRLKF